MESLRQRACMNLNDLVPVTDAPITGYPMLLASPVANSFSNLNPGLLGNNILEQGINYHADIFCSGSWKDKDYDF